MAARSCGVISPRGSVICSTYGSFASRVMDRLGKGAHAREIGSCRDDTSRLENNTTCLVMTPVFIKETQSLTEKTKQKELEGAQTGLPCYYLTKQAGHSEATSFSGMILWQLFLLALRKGFECQLKGLFTWRQRLTFMVGPG